MLVMRKQNLELRHEALAEGRRQKRWAKTREQVPCSISRSHGHVAVGTDDGRGSLAREELRAMAIEARLVFRKISYVRKRIVAFADLFPIFRGKFVARVAVELLRLHVRAV